MSAARRRPPPVEADDTEPDLLVRFEELVLAGAAPDPERFAAEHPERPELLAELRRLAALRGELDTALAPRPAWPRRVGDWELERLLGEGGMGAVFCARHRAQGGRAALKLLAWETPAARVRFAREARLAAGLSHPGIAAVREWGEQDGRLYLVCELVDGASLRALLGGAPPSSGPRLPGAIAERVALVLQVAEALAYAHAAGVVHRDVKPSNVLLGVDGVVKLIDFGLALELGSRDARVTRTGIFIGSHNYAAPEQVKGDKRAVGPWTDTYGACATLFELVTGRPPFVCPSFVARALLADAPPPHSARALAPAVPAGLDALLRRGLDPRRTKRFSDGAALCAALRRWLARPR